LTWSPRPSSAAVIRLQPSRSRSCARATLADGVHGDGVGIARHARMLAAINTKIVADLDALAVAWEAVASELAPTAKAPRPRGRDRKRKASPKS